MDDDLRSRFRYTPPSQPKAKLEPTDNLTDLRPVVPTAPKPGSPAPHRQHIPYQPQRSQPNQHPPVHHKPAPPPPQLQPAQYKPAERQQVKKRSLRPRLSLKFAGVLAVALIIAVAAFALTHHTAKKEVAVKSIQTAAPYESPAFQVYFPTKVPSGSGIFVDKSLIAYYKNIFSTILRQDGKKAYFIDEVSAPLNSLNDLRAQLKSPQNFSSSLGSGVSGGFDQGAMVAVQTKDNTLIKISCSVAGCDLISKLIINSMEPVSNPASLK
jgi:hypothetical protein